MQARAPQVLIQDDGELDALRVLLDEIGVPYAEAMSDPSSEVTLLFSTPRHALRLGSVGSLLPDSATHFVLAESISNTTRAQLHRFDCQYVVDQAFHVEAISLLILHSLYQGPERRRSNRIALGEEIKLKRGWRSYAVTLIQLSERGCRVVCDWDGKADKEISLVFPKSLTEGASVSARGKVVARGGTKGGGNSLSIVFTGLTSELRKSIKSVMKRRALGDFCMSPDTGGQPPGDVESNRSESPPEERRRSLRAEYEQRVLAVGGGRSRALLGRDLSVGGMLVEPNDEIIPGEKVKLVLFGKAGSDPIIVCAEVLRDSGETGVALRFENLNPEIRSSLQALVDSLPLISGGEPGTDNARHGRSLVVSGLLERRRS
jgi:hypothetical protein